MALRNKIAIGKIPVTNIVFLLSLEVGLLHLLEKLNTDEIQGEHSFVLGNSFVYCRSNIVEVISFRQIFWSSKFWEKQ